MNEELAVQKLIDHEERLKRIEEGMFTKKEGRKLFETMDDVHRIVQKLDQELTMGTQRVNRIEKTVERHEQDILGIKTAITVN